MLGHIARRNIAPPVPPHRVDPACASLHALVARRVLGNPRFSCVLSRGCDADAIERNSVWHSEPHVRELLRLRALVLSGRARPAATASVALAWLMSAAPLWALVSVCEALPREAAAAVRYYY